MNSCTERLNDWVNGWMDGWMDEGMNDWMNEFFARCAYNTYIEPLRTAHTGAPHHQKLENGTFAHCAYTRAPRVGPYQKEMEPLRTAHIWQNIKSRWALTELKLAKIKSRKYCIKAPKHMHEAEKQRSRDAARALQSCSMRAARAFQGDSKK